MLYKFLKIVVGISLKIFFKKIYVYGTENIQLNKAQIIASNHPNGFLEPILMACFLPKPLYFLVRGDIFKNPIANYFLRATHQIPIFRFRDGFSKLRNNSKTIDESLQVLNNKNNLLIFAEGGTQSIKKLRPLQKGMARIAFQTLEQFPNLDLEILPTGINFTYPTEFNKEVYLKIGQPISVKPFYDMYCQDKNKGTESLLDAIYHAMKENVIHIEDQHLAPLFENTISAVRLKKTFSYLPVLRTDEERLKYEINWARQLDSAAPKSIANIKDSVENIKRTYKKHGLKSQDIEKKPINLTSFLILLLGFLPALIGLFYHILPLATGFYFKNKIVKQREFKASIQFALVVFLTLIQYTLFLILSILFENIFIGWVLPIITGLWARFYYYYFDKTQWVKKEIHEEYKSQYDAIIDSLN